MDLVNPTAAPANQPTIYEWPTANVALVVAAMAFLVALGSLIVTYRTYRRAGTRVSVTSELGTALVPGKSLSVITVSVINSGLAATTVRNVAFRHKSNWWRRWDRKAIFQEPDGTFVKFPSRIEGNAEGTFVYIRKELQPHFSATHSGRTIIRAKVTLSTGEVHYGNRLRVDTGESIDVF